MTANPTPLPPEGVMLKPCPFCGGNELGLNRPSDHRTGPHWHDWFIRCYGCHVETSEYRTEAEAVAAWNTRIASTSAAGEPVAFRYRFKDEFAHMAERSNSWVLANQNPELSRTKAWRDLRIIEPLYASTSAAGGEVGKADAPDEITRLKERATKAAAANARLREAVEKIKDLPGEINPSNYDHDDVCYLNAQFIEAYNIARQALDQGSEG